MRGAVVLLVTLLASSAMADLYMHSPRGSNNRLNEQNAERDDGNRMFDSQNNNRGGYNIGDKNDQAAADNTNVDNPQATYDYTDITTAQQYQMVYYEGSILPIGWTNQHGCGGEEAANPATAQFPDLQQDPSNTNCNLVVQWTCDTDPTAVSNPDPSLMVKLVDGTTTDQQNTAGTDTTAGNHESVAWYSECNTRTRNLGLFTADQNLQGNTAIYTRQNAGGGRSGLECSEERDYYPYWQPTPWMDIAYLTDTVSMCPYIIANSQNNNVKMKCQGTTQQQLDATNPTDCANAGGIFTQHTFNIAQPDCQPVPWSRTNHLGNGRFGQMNGYNWTIPMLASLPDIMMYDSYYAKCVLRLRYNISTGDYDPWNTNSTYNTQTGGVSPVTQNPTVDVGADLQGLKLALNTNQFGRTFQDRSHTFFVRKRPTGNGAPNLGTDGTNLWNLNVRGKRGNIVQTYPANEYDFVPNHLTISTNDFLHIQWTGSNTHDNGGNGGDGQTGDAGEGTGGTDRHNFVLNTDPGVNYPMPLDKYPDNMFSQSLCWDVSGIPIGSTASGAGTATNVNCALWLATSGYYRQPSDVVGTSDGTDDLSPTLDNAPASLIGGIVMQINAPGLYNYSCTRNNNFSNRSQKGQLIVQDYSAPQ